MNKYKDLYTYRIPLRKKFFYAMIFCDEYQVFKKR